MAIARANAPELTRGARAIAFVKNPNDPVWAKDPAVALYRSILKRFAPSAKPTDVYHWYGMTVAWTMVDVLKRAGKSPTRAGVLRAAREASTRPPTPSCSPARACARRRRTDSRSTPCTCIATTTGSGSARRARSPPDDARANETEERNAHEEADTYGRARARGARRARARRRRNRGVHVRRSSRSRTGPATSRASSRRRRANDDSTARAAIVIPNGTSITTTAAPGTKVGTAQAQVSALALGGALLPLLGDIIVAPPGAVAPATQAQCTQGATPQLDAARSSCRRRARRSTCRRTSSRRAAPQQALGSAQLVFCLPPPDIPVAQGGATFGAKFLSADLTLNGVFGPVLQGAWVAFWTPWQAGNGQINAAGTVASPAAIAPGRPDAHGSQGARREAALRPRHAGGRRRRVARQHLRRRGPGDAPPHRGRLGEGQRHLHVRGAAAVEGDDVPGTRRSREPGRALGLQRSSRRSAVPCVNATVSGFAATSRNVTLR